MPIAYVLLLLLSFAQAVSGDRPFIWYGIALLTPAISMYLQHLSDMVSGDELSMASYTLDRALVQGLLVFAGAVAVQEVRKRQAHMRELRTLLQKQNLALEKGRQSEFDLEAQVSLRTQDLAMAARRLESLSSIDGMTGIANRRRFDETLPVEWGRAARDKRPLSVALIDVDWFKSFNDHYGHPAGDRVLRRVARSLAAGLSPEERHRIARYGGEEFVLVLSGMADEAAAELAETLRSAVATLAIPHGVGGSEGVVTLSGGLASCEAQPGRSAKEVVAAADSMLYAAKAAGRNRLCVHPGAPVS
jgi:diguanylate cyclase (GGDEF)-like protein